MTAQIVSATPEEALLAGIRPFESGVYEVHASFPEAFQNGGADLVAKIHDAYSAQDMHPLEVLPPEGFTFEWSADEVTYEAKAGRFISRNTALANRFNRLLASYKRRLATEAAPKAE